MTDEERATATAQLIENTRLWLIEHGIEPVEPSAAYPPIILPIIKELGPSMWDPE